MTESKPSKSARKRAQLELQQLGDQLIGLNNAELASMPLNEPLRSAIETAKNIKAHGALRRQRQLVGKLMRDIDTQPIRDALARLRADDLRQKRLFSRAEKWRDRIVREGQSALVAFESETGAEDRELQSLLRELGSVFSDRAEKTVRRKIFRRCHAILVRIAA